MTRASAMQVGALTLPMHRLIYALRAASKCCKCWPGVKELNAVDSK